MDNHGAYHHTIDLSSCPAILQKKVEYRPKKLCQPDGFPESSRTSINQGARRSGSEISVILIENSDLT